MSFATASCDLWQNEQRSDSSEPRDVFMVAATPGVGPVVLGTLLSLHPDGTSPTYTEVTAIPLSGHTHTVNLDHQNVKPRRRGRGLKVGSSHPRFVADQIGRASCRE